VKSDSSLSADAAVETMRREVAILTIPEPVPELHTQDTRTRRSTSGERCAESEYADDNAECTADDEDAPLPFIDLFDIVEAEYAVGSGMSCELEEVKVRFKEDEEGAEADDGMAICCWCCVA